MTWSGTASPYRPARSGQVPREEGCRAGASASPRDGHLLFQAMSSGSNATAGLAVLAQEPERGPSPLLYMQAGVPWLQPARGKDALRSQQQAVRQAGLDVGKLKAWVPKQVGTP